jgi:hypothetical protein
MAMYSLSGSRPQSAPTSISLQTARCKLPLPSWPRASSISPSPPARVIGTARPTTRSGRAPRTRPPLSRGSSRAATPSTPAGCWKRSIYDTSSRRGRRRSSRRAACATPATATGWDGTSRASRTTRSCTPTTSTRTGRLTRGSGVSQAAAIPANATERNLCVDLPGYTEREAVMQCVWAHTSLSIDLYVGPEPLPFLPASDPDDPRPTSRCPDRHPRLAWQGRGARAQND